MKIRVQHEDGRMETLTLKEPLEVHGGQYLNHITDSSGMEYFFTQDGHYDGWGLPLPGLPEDEVGVLLEAIEQQRDFRK